MKLINTLSLASLALGAPTKVSTEDFSSVQIVGGLEASQGDFPFMVAFYYDGLFNCGGSLLNSNTVLTAAHCLDGRVASKMNVRIGSLVGLFSDAAIVNGSGHETDLQQNRSEGGIAMSVTSFKVHPQYDRDSSNNDVAILKLRDSVPASSTVSYAKLPPANSDPSAGSILTVAGWGLLSQNTQTQPTLLRKVDLPVVSRSQCRAAYQSSAVTDQMFCAGYQAGGKDSCTSDSGGPIVDAAKTVVGIVSWGQGCAIAGYPGVYARVSVFLDWINSA